jgi:hypothetical protein
MILSTVYITTAFANLDLDSKKLVGTSNDSELKLIFSDGKMSGSLTFEDQIIEFENQKVILRNDRFLVSDKNSGIIVFGKQINAEKYIVLLKLHSDEIKTKLRFISTLDTINKISQRDLLQEMQNSPETGDDPKTISARELQLFEKQKIEEFLKKFDQKLERITQQQEKNLKNSNDIINSYKQYKSNTVDNRATDKKPTVESTILGPKVNVLVSQYDRVTKGNSYVFQVKTFDAKKYSGTDWSKFEGKIDGVNISANITGPDGQVKEKFSGLTKYGMFQGSIMIKDNPWPQGIYTLNVNSEFQDEKTSKSLKFFVIEEGASANTPPVPDAGPDQSVTHPTHVTLDASASSDPNGDRITYSWTQISGASVTMTDPTAPNPSFDTIGEGVFIFQLTVSDGKDTSIDTVTITVN